MKIRKTVQGTLAFLFLLTTGCAFLDPITADGKADTKTLNKKAIEKQTSDRVKPWERDYLAKPEMAWQPDQLQSEFMNHAYTSKEASSGGDKTAGGGCGCN